MGLERIHVTTPAKMQPGNDLGTIVAKFETLLAKEVRNQECYVLEITGRYSQKIREEVEKLYLQAGWETARCRTKSNEGVSCTELLLTTTI